MPVDEIATAMTDLAFSAERLPALVNLVHPRAVTWEKIMQTVCKAINASLRMVSLKDWLHSLEEASEKSSSELLDEIVSDRDICLFVHSYSSFVQPAIKLLGFLRTLLPPDEAGSYDHRPSFSTVELQRYSETMRTLEPLDDRHVKAWVKYWVTKGFLAVKA